MTTQARKSIPFRRIAGIALTALAVSAIAPVGHAGIFKDAAAKAKAKVTRAAPAIRKAAPAVRKKATGALDRVVDKVEEVRGNVQVLSDKVGRLTDLGDVASGIGDGAIGAIVDSVQPLVALVRERQQDFQAFDAEGFRYDLTEAVENIAYLQSALIGRVGPGISRLQDKVAGASPVLLFAMSETPLAGLLETTKGMGDELRTVVRLTTEAADDINDRLPSDQARRAAGLGMAIAAPEFVSCSFVLDNVDGDDITNLKLSRLRAKQISGVAGLALKVLPKSQTVGVNVVGGATLSIPNPVTPLTAAIQKVADKYYNVSKEWTKKYDTCKRLRLNERLGNFLEAEGFPFNG